MFFLSFVVMAGCMLIENRHPKLVMEMSERYMLTDVIQALFIVSCVFGIILKYQTSRVDEKRNRNVEGTGLGLNLTKNLVEMMDGEITVSSVYGQGSTFRARIQQMIKSHEPIGDFAKRYHEEMEKESRKTENVYAPEARVLVVDDVPMNLLTANAVLGAREEYMQAGFTDYLTKPIQEKELNDVLLKYLPQEKLSLHIEGDEEETEVRIQQVYRRQTRNRNWLKSPDSTAIDVTTGRADGTKPGDAICHGRRGFFCPIGTNRTAWSGKDKRTVL